MAQIKKNALAQVLFVEVSPTDYAAIISTLTVMPTAKYFGVNHGGSAAVTSGTISKAISQVHSGIFRLTAKPAETNFDYVLYRIIQASCADQILTFQCVDNDDSDLMSALTVIQSLASDAHSAASDARSLLIAGTFAMGASNLSDIGSRVWADTIGTRVDSRLLLNQSRISDAYSMLSDFYSDFQSRVPKAVATNSQLSDLQSDLRSYLVVMSGVQSDLYSLLSDLQSDFQSRVPKRVATDSQVSDLQSDLRSFLTVMSGVQSDVYSLLSDFQSDFQSRVPKAVATNSQLSDLHSDLRSYLVGISGMLSDTYSLLSDANSDIRSQIQEALVVRRSTAQAGAAGSITLDAGASATTDFYKGLMIALVANTGAGQAREIIAYNGATKVATVAPAWITNPDVTTIFVIENQLPSYSLASNINSMLVAGTFALGASNLSDVGSRVWADTIGTRVDSRVLLNLSRISDVYSMVSDLQSDFQSRVPKRVATDSQLSDLHSDLRSFLAVMSGIQSDVYSLLSDFQSDFQSRVPKRVATDSQVSDLHSDLRSYLVGMSGMLSDTYSLLSDANSDLRSQVQELLVVRRNTAQTGAAGSITLDAGASATTDLYKGLLIALVGGTGAGQVREIIAYNGATKVASIFPNWTTSPDVTTIFTIQNSTGSRSHLSDVASDLRSFLAIMSGVQSDVYSLLSDFQSDFQSRVPKRVATDSQLSDLQSDLKSHLNVTSAVISDLYSLLSDLSSRVNSTSFLSDIASQVWAHAIGTRVDSRVLVIQSAASDARSAASNIESMLIAGTFILGASNLSDIGSRVWSEKYHAHSLASSFGSLFSVMGTNDAAAASRALLNQSRISDVYSMLSDLQSDFQSRVPKRVATDSQLSDLQSDLKSHLNVTSAVISDLYSLLSDLQSDFQSRVPKRVATDSQLSDLQSDLRSLIVAGVGLTVSAISDIGSRVWGEKYQAHSLASSFGSLFSVMATNDAAAASRALVNQSRISDVYSLLSDANSDLRSLLVTTGIALDASTMSDLRSAIAGVTATLTASDISDIASAVDATLASRLSDILSAAVQTNSRALVILSGVSDVYSLLSDVQSDFQSRVPKRVATDSQLSDLHSDLKSHLNVTSAVVSDLYSLLSDLSSKLLGASYLSDIASQVWAAKYTGNSTASSFGSLVSDMFSRLVLVQSAASDAASAAAQTNSRVLLNQSRLSDAYSMLSDLYSDFQSRVPKRVATDSQVSDLISDLRSFLTLMSDVQSDIYSLLTAGVPVGISSISDIASRVWSEKYHGHSLASSFGSLFSVMATGDAAAASRALLNQSRISDVYSMLSDLQSDFQSRVPKRVATDSQLSDLQSDLKSHLNVTSAVISDLYSLLSDLQSDFQSRVPKRVATDSQLSNTQSDLRSLVSGMTAAITASDISDIASAVDAVLASRLSDILSAAVQTNSRTLVVKSQASDVYSMLSDFFSDFQSRVPKRVATDSQLSDLTSDLRSLIAAGVLLDASTMSDIRSAIAGITATLGASDISDIASAVDGILASRLSDILSAAQQTNSRALLAVSSISDVYSLLSDLQSDFQSRVPKRVATDSQLSNAHSDIRSMISGITASVNASDISDIASAVRAVLVSDLSDILSVAQQTNSRALVNQSRVSDIYSLLSDFQSDFQSRVPKRVATDSQLSDLQSDLKSHLNVTSAVLSDLYSLLSDLSSKLGGTSFLSDIASQVWAHTVGARVDSRVLAIESAASDAASAAQEASSRALLNQSRISDVYSLLGAGVPLDASTMSDIRSAVGTVTLTASDVSDIASAVRAGVVSDLSDILSAARQANSRVLESGSGLSDIYSLLSDLQSDFQSRVPKRVATQSQLSDVQSDINSNILVIGGALAASIGDVYSSLSDIGSDVSAIKDKTDNLPTVIKKNVALNNFEFVMIDASNHVTPKTGLTVTAQRSIDGGAFVACTNAVSELANGVYIIDLSANDLNGNCVTLRFTAAGADDRLLTIITND